MSNLLQNTYVTTNAGLGQVEQPKTFKILGKHHVYGQCIISDKHKLIYILIPKNASSTLRNYMKTKLDGYENNYFNCNNNQKKYTTFCIFRNSIEKK
jgi:hypothetical protein